MRVVPSDIRLAISNRVPLPNLLRSCETKQNWHSICKTEYFWKLLVTRYFNKENKNGYETWKEYFYSLYEFAYSNVYINVFLSNPEGDIIDLYDYWLQLLDDLLTGSPYYINIVPEEQYIIRGSVLILKFPLKSYVYETIEDFTLFIHEFIADAIGLYSEEPNFIKITYSLKSSI